MSIKFVDSNFGNAFFVVLAAGSFYVEYTIQC